MSGRCLVLILAILSLTTARSINAQQSAKVPRIGFLTQARAAAIASRLEAFRQGLRDLGYVEGKNIVVEWRDAGGNGDRMREMVAELVRLKVDAIVSAGPTITRLFKDTGTEIPIVMGQDSDPVGSGFIASLAHPGGNITGLATLAPEMAGKQLETMKQIIPRLSRVAIIGNSTVPGDAQAARETLLVAGAYEIYLRYLDVLEAKDIDSVFRSAAKGRADAIIVLGNPILNAQRKQIGELVAKLRLPAAYNRPEFIDAGGLMYYGTNYNDLFRRAAAYVDKILKGAKPADLPVEQPIKFDFVINLKAAKQINLTIPPNVLARATRVIK